MKTNLVLAMLFLIAGVAKADFNSDIPGKAIRCTGNQTVVVINKARTRIKVIDLIDPGHPNYYDVVKRQSDGDTEIGYLSKGDEVELWFSDRGDALDYNGSKPTILPLQCP